MLHGRGVKIEWASREGHVPGSVARADGQRQMSSKSARLLTLDDPAINLVGRTPTPEYDAPLRSHARASIRGPLERTSSSRVD
jgi:hypothetical protein